MDHIFGYNRCCPLVLLTIRWVHWMVCAVQGSGVRTCDVAGIDGDHLQEGEHVYGRNASVCMHVWATWPGQMAITVDVPEMHTRGSVRRSASPTFWPLYVRMYVRLSDCLCMRPPFGAAQCSGGCSGGGGAGGESLDDV